MNRNELNTNVEGNNVKLKLVCKSDAKFISEIRTDERLGLNISKTSSDVQDQEKWIDLYKKREKEHKEFYFVFEDLNHKAWGTVRIYDIDKDNFTIGSWICLPGNDENIAIKAWLLCIEFGFEKLNIELSKFDIRKKNRTVLYFAYLFHPILIREDELNFYFRLDKNTYYKNRKKVARLLKIEL